MIKMKGKQRKRKCSGCGNDFNTKEMSNHISDIIRSLQV